MITKKDIMNMLKDLENSNNRAYKRELIEEIIYQIKAMCFYYLTVGLTIKEVQ